MKEIRRLQGAKSYKVKGTPEEIQKVYQEMQSNANLSGQSKEQNIEKTMEQIKEEQQKNIENKRMTTFDLVNEFSKELKQIIFEKDCKSIIKDFPIEGVNFIDLNEFYIEPKIYTGIITHLCMIAETMPKPDVIIATEARGFLIGSALAAVMGVSFIPIRKVGKLPIGRTIDNQLVSVHQFRSSTEYSFQNLCISTKSIQRLNQIFQMKNSPEDLLNLHKSIVFDSHYVDYAMGYTTVDRVFFEEPYKAVYGDTIKPVDVLLVDDLLATGSTFESIHDFLQSFWGKPFGGNLSKGSLFKGNLMQKPETNPEITNNLIYQSRDLPNLSSVLKSWIEECNSPIKFNTLAALSVVDLDIVRSSKVQQFNFETKEFDVRQGLPQSAPIQDEDGNIDVIKSYSLVRLPEGLDGEFNSVNKL